MRRILFHIFGVPIYSYPAMLYVGIVLGIYAQLYAARSIGLDRERMLAATLILLMLALAGARLLFVLAHLEFYKSHLQRIFRLSEGGMSMYGGLLLAVPLSVRVLAAIHIPFGVFWDVASFTMLIGMTVTRVGCFLNGCCAGKPTHGFLGVWLPDYRGAWVRRIPTQVLEAAWGIIVLSGSCLLWHRLTFPGALFLYVMGAYGAGRIVLESTRDEQDRLFGLTLHRALSGVFVAVSLAAFTFAWWWY